MSKPLPIRLSRRERQIMDFLYARGEAAALEVREAMEDPPSYSAVRTFLRILEEKGHVTHTEIGGRYVYRPVQSWGQVSKSALEHVVETFFGGSLEKTVATLLSDTKRRPTDEELRRMEELIASARAAEREEDEQ